MLPCLALLPRPLKHCARRVSTISRTVSNYLDHEGEWLWNGALQRSRRRVHLDIDALQNIASSAVCAQRCIQIESLAQGSYNKVFHLGFDNGAEAIARIPCALVGNVHMSTASEVATMEYVREVFGKPTPRVLTWSSTSEARTAVGTDFILMEYIQGAPLEDRWLNTFDEDIGVVLRELIHFDIDIHQRPFSQIGSLFFKEDVSPKLQSRPLYLRESDNKESVADKYRIGPIVDNQYWFGGEEPVVGDRGPWPDMTTFLQATCRLALRRAEYQAASVASSCPSSSSLLSRSKPDDLPELRQLLRHCISMVPYLTPSEPAIVYPFLSHPDLSRSNVIVQSSGAANIVSYIDWQGAAATPYLMGPDLPPAMRYEGSLIPFPDDPFSPPDMPPDIPPELKEQAELEWRLAKRHRAMASILLRNVPMRFATACVHRLDLLRSLPDTALRCYADGPHRLRHLVFEMYKEWSAIMEGSASPAECPVQLTAVEIVHEREEYAAYSRYQQRRDEALAMIRGDPDGWMSEENTEVMRQRWAVAREKWNEDGAGGLFPLEDGMWSFHLT
ncbi:kinase-like domain-containing protein [Armillaria borealis]|uniref:Altered inheritance of mitochondria protein 9, mitochondrial n=1 Tax=Armillaria borealis TaxID=47425 RepID=A0AA39MV71_9AGAR|nr:kinase-like domain-containing protein [Armillaria borealis]